MALSLRQPPQNPYDHKPLPVSGRGLEILNDPLLNKGTSFSIEERDTLGLRGLIPPFVADMEEQVQRAMENYRHKTDPLDKYTFLIGLHDRNVTLFYRVLMEHLTEMTPIMYTPTVGFACQQFGHIYRKNRGMYISLHDKGRIAEVLANWPSDEVDIIVISDGSRILGLGDLGANGMGIPIGKLVLYVAGAGLDPNRTLPILLDVGTDNADLLCDPLYLGITHRRVHGDEFYEIVDEFVQAATKRWPQVLIQWEDFTNDKAFPLLQRYRDEILCFNDDIQGTGAVALSGLMGALRITKETLSDQRIMFYGAGSASVGIADMICAGICEESGVSLDQARERIWLIDSRGLVTTSRGELLEKHKKPYAREEQAMDNLVTTINEIKPTVLIGASGMPQSFTEKAVKAMHKHCKRPVIFALSNPTTKSECTAKQAYTWTRGDAIFASGSPFDPVRLNGRIFIPGQGNNMFIFPGMGLGAIACGARTISDGMFFIAAKTLAHMVTEEELQSGTVYPDLAKIRQISVAIATAVCQMAYDDGLAQIPEPSDLREYIRNLMYHPEYKEYVAV